MKVRIDFDTAVRLVQMVERLSALPPMQGLYMHRMELYILQAVAKRLARLQFKGDKPKAVAFEQTEIDVVATRLGLLMNYKRIDI